MGRRVKTVQQYINFLESKGFALQEDALGFIQFGQRYTNASDELTNIAIELTLKAQREFDGSFYISLLEMFVKGEIKSRGAAIRFIKEQEIMAI
jgi:Family of unknown function (DUF6123)